MDNVPDKLISAYFEGSLDEAQSAELSRWVLASKDNALYLASLAKLEQGLVKHAKMQSNSDLLAELQEAEAAAPLVLISLDEVPQTLHSDRSDHLTKHEYASALSYVLKHTFTPKRIAIFATAAALMLGVVLAITMLTGPDENETIAEVPDAPATQTEPARFGPLLPDVPPSVATLTATHNATWAKGASAPGSLTPGSKLHPNQRLTLTAGFAEITTNRGAVAILEAPATIELLDNDNALRLHTGKLVGICETETSKGFLVRTSHMDITDLGTRFGVAIDRQGNTLAEVFEGSVTVQPNNGFNSSNAKQTLARGESYGVSPTGTRLTREQFTPAIFARLGETAAGIQLSGAVRWSAHAFDPTDPVQWPVDQTNAFVIEEIRDVRVPADFPVVLEKPGQMTAFVEASATSQVTAGTRIRSYAVLFNPGENQAKLICQGEVTFDGEVLGVIVNRNHGDAFIKVLGNDASRVIRDNVPRPRSWPEDNSGEKLSDHLTLQADGRTLAFNFVVQSESDLIRVIVREPTGADPGVQP